MTNKLFGVGDQTSANAACQGFKNGVGSLVTGTTLCDAAYRGTIYVSNSYTAISGQAMKFFDKEICDICSFDYIRTKIECTGCQ